MKTIITQCLAAAILFTSCNNEATNSEATVVDNTKTETAAADSLPPNVSNDTTTPNALTDENGCKTSGGEQWSMIKKLCVNLPLTGIKLQPKDALDKMKPAYILFSEDKVRVEIFLPTQKKSVVIRRSADTGTTDKWINGPLTLELKDDLYTIYDEGKMLYQGAKPE